MVPSDIQLHGTFNRFDDQNDAAQPEVQSSGATVGQPSAGSDWRPVVESPEFGIHALQWLWNFHAGYRHRVTLRLRAGQRGRLRLELNGRMTRYQRCFCDIDLASGEVQPAEEMLSATSTALPGGGYEFSCVFMPQTSASHWFYAMAAEGDITAVGPVLGVAYEVSSFRFERAAAPEPGFRPLRYNGAVEVQPSVWFGLQSFLILRNYFHLEFEIDAAGHGPVESITLTASRAVTAVHWMSPDPPSSAPRSRLRRLFNRLRVKPSQVTAPPARTVSLKPAIANRPLSSPGLFEHLGAAGGNRGHAIWGLFNNWTNLSEETPSESADVGDLALRFVFADGTLVHIGLDPATVHRLANPAQPSVQDVFWSRVNAAPPGKFLEIGGRGPNASSNRRRFGDGWSYIAFDVLAGENVDVVGDAHNLSEYFPPQSIDFIFADQVLEHLLAPWRFIVEANKVLKPGGVMCLMTPSTCPLHAEPWDFYRFSDHCLVALFNSKTGFEIVDRSLSFPLVVLPRVHVAKSERMQYEPAFLVLSALVRKIAPATAEWAAYDRDLAFGLYPRDRV